MTHADQTSPPFGFIDHRARREYALMALAVLLFSISHNYSALLAIVFERSGHSIPSTGLLLTLFAITAIGGSLLSSAIAARFGIMRAVRWAIILTGIGMGSFAFTRDSFALALISRLVQGLGVGLLVPVALVYIQSRLNRDNAVVLLTGFTAVVPLAAAIAPPLGEWTLARYGMTALFVGAALPAAIGVLLTIGLRDAPRPDNAGGLNLHGAFERHLYLPYLVMLAGGSLYGYSVNYLAASMQERAILLAAFFIPSSIALIVVRFGAIWFMGKLGPRLLVTLSLLTYGTGYLFIASANGPLWMVIGAVFFGIGNSINFPIIAAWVGEGLDPARRVAPQAVNNACFYFGMYASPWPQSFVIAAWGYGVMEWAWAAIGLILTLVMFGVLAQRGWRG